MIKNSKLQLIFENNVFLKKKYYKLMKQFLKIKWKMK